MRVYLPKRTFDAPSFSVINGKYIPRFGIEKFCQAGNILQFAAWIVAYLFADSYMGLVVAVLLLFRKQQTVATLFAMPQNILSPDIVCYTYGIIK